MKEQYKYVKNLLSDELVEFLSSRSLDVASKGINKPDKYGPMAKSRQSSQSEIEYHLT